MRTSDQAPTTPWPRINSFHPIPFQRLGQGHWWQTIVVGKAVKKLLG
jgi:hypothetical protein